MTKVQETTLAACLKGKKKNPNSIRIESLSQAHHSGFLCKGMWLLLIKRRPRIMEMIVVGLLLKLALDGGRIQGVNWAAMRKIRAAIV